MTTRKDLKGISLSKFSQRKTNSIWPHLQMKSETDKQNQNKKQNWTHREYIGGCQGQENGGSGRKCSRGTKFQL